MPKPTITLIAAATENNVIGRDNAMPWHLPADLAHFKRLTQGKPIVMGRKNYESIGRPLPGRHNIILTRNPGYSAEGCTVVDSPEAALAEAGDVAEVMIIGGEEIYRLFLEQADQVHLTRIHAHIAGDTRFPALLENEWRLAASEHRPADQSNAYDLAFQTYERHRHNI
ncbi:type 3 dihydrofolate reductase [Alkalilimnicola sp. S0819]|uniref:type 3 dihydrofolate reductase n=1 Tax=Alkalilimnicola sp. S0819 TaxID=2613922 RepID=UPI0012614395|nr:type 3 dihydrofolate reductase [Alkalilimnicola sp. S0819]KAB7623002.1 type 3 dihydrofolate reductase [Alkalilimnicola sp. S0819]MPQ17114.1 type 3 dihydrofolate reductase [Alkalilimnicola sp. S0819]